MQTLNWEIKMKIFGVAGQLRNGKDEIADFLASKLSYKRAAFAYNVKRIFCETFGVDLEFIEKWKTIPESPPGFDMPIRQALQFIGDGFRKIKNDIWVDLVFRNDPKEIVISDCRYINELKEIKKNGGLNILVYRPGFLNDDPNKSESQIKPFVLNFIEKGIEGKVKDDNENFSLIDYFIINDGTLEDLHKKIDNFIR
jgi:hypothetical protein